MITELSSQFGTKMLYLSGIELKIRNLIYFTWILMNSGDKIGKNCQNKQIVNSCRGDK